VLCKHDNGGVQTEGVVGQIQRRAARVGLTLDDGVAERIGAYLGLLTKWNQRLNLTALDLEPMADEAVDRLVVESLVAAESVHPRDGLLVDVGSGGGSPAIPMKLLLPSLRMVLVESKTKKSAFLREAVRQLELSDTVVETDRIEALSVSTHLLSAADVVSMRAVRADAVLWQAVARLLKPGGRVLWFGAPPQDAFRLVTPLELIETRTLLPEAPNELAILKKLD
jgi:16S rRNA (guanine527-N7)-methyltransferase